MSIGIGGFRRTRDLVKKLLSQDPKSACSQVSVALFYVRTVKSVRAWICTDDVHVSRLQAKNRQHHPGPERRRGGGEVRGVRSNPPIDLQKILYTCALPLEGWSSSSLSAIENHRCLNKSGCSYVGLFLED